MSLEHNYNSSEEFINKYIINKSEQNISGV